MQRKDDLNAEKLPLLPSVRKKAGVRSWLVIDAAGESEVVEAGKHAIMRRTGLPARDLRILDPLLSYPSTMLGRDRAIVINLEHIKAIITAKEVLLLNSRDPSVIPFVDEIQTRISRLYQAAKSQEAGKADWKEVVDLEACSNEKQGSIGEPCSENQDSPKLLPFEFVTLEACLEAACGSLETEAMTLELEAHSALDKLTSEISTLNLDCVRQIKSRLVAITGRVQKVRDELEHLIDDDEDLVEMFLTEKLQEETELMISVSSWIKEEDEEQEQVPGSTRSDASKRVDVEELEMLLEAYFIQMEGILNSLSALKEYVEDTEDYINIMLDDKQNQLLQMGIQLSTATFAVTIFIIVTAFMGMNLRIPVFDDTSHGDRNFALVCTITFAVCLTLYVSAVLWYRHKGLLE